MGCPPGRSIRTFSSAFYQGRGKKGGEEGGRVGRGRKMKGGGRGREVKR